MRPLALSYTDRNTIKQTRSNDTNRKTIEGNDETVGQLQLKGFNFGKLMLLVATKHDQRQTSSL